MKKLEEILKNVSKPKVGVDAFRRKLRHRLLDSHPGGERSPSFYKAALAGTSMLSLILAGVLVLFVARPSYPVQLHYAFVPESESSSPSRIAKDAKEEPPADPSALDERLVRTWVRERFKTQPVKIEPLDDTETYTVRRFKLDNGRYVQIHTRVPRQGEMQRVSY